MLKDLLYILQLENYDLQRFEKWWRKHQNNLPLLSREKFVWTAKAKLLYFTALPLQTIIHPYRAIAAAVSFWKPLELLLKTVIIALAKIKLKTMANLTVIGIAGSFGKTSTKEILYQILSSKFKVLKTPESYNTPLGISRVVLTKLKSHHQILIVEMGAYSPNDIKLLCDISKPKVGILTAIGKQHLQRFRSLNNIKKTKTELLNSLPANGIGIVNISQKPTQEALLKYGKTKSKLVLFVSRKINVHKQLRQRTLLSLRATKIRHNGLNALLYSDRGDANISRNIFHENIERLVMETNLLGRQNLDNISLAAITALLLRMKPGEIESAIKNLSPIPHRLSSMVGAHKTIILDNSYSSNPASYPNSFEVLSKFKNSRKIVVTPGMVELDRDQFAENKKMGAAIAKVADFLIIVGNTNKKALSEGWNNQRGKSVAARLITTTNLEEAKKELARLTLPHSVILFENDLPENYQ